MPGLDLMTLSDVHMAKAVVAKGELNDLQKVLGKSKFIADLKVPELPMRFETKHKEGSIYHRHVAKNASGYIVVNGEKVHPLQVFAGLKSGHVGDVDSVNVENIAGRDLIADSDAPFQPFTSVEGDMFTMISGGQHERNGLNNTKHKEVLVINIPYEYVVELGVNDVKLVDNIYIRRGDTLVVKVELEHAEFFHKDLYIYADSITKLSKELVQLNMGTGSKSLFYFKGTSKSMDTKELVEIIASMNDEFALDHNAEGRIIRKATIAQKTALGKWLKETIVEVGEVKHHYSYLYTSLTAEVKGNTYDIKVPMVRPSEPNVGKPENYDDILNFFFNDKLSEKELTSLLAKGIASAFDIKHIQAKELLHILKVCSDWGKTQILASALVKVSMAAKFDVMDFISLTGAVAGASKSGKNPLLLGMYPFSIFDEAKVPDKKIDLAFVDKLKSFHELDIRAMQQMINTIIKGHQVLVLSRVGVSALDNVHDEFLTRIVRLHPSKNEPYDKRFRLEEVTTCLAWFMYEKSTEIIDDVLAMDTMIEKEKYFDNLIDFEYIKVKHAEKKKANNFKYGVLCNIIKDGVEELLTMDIEHIVDPYYRYPKEQAVIACSKGQIAFVSKRHLYEYTNDNIADGTRADILDVLENASTGKTNTQGQSSVYPLKIDGSKSVSFVYTVDVEEIKKEGVPEAISSMTYDEVVNRVAEMDGMLSPIMWSILAKHLINLGNVSNVVKEELGGLDEFTK